MGAKTNMKDQKHKWGQWLGFGAFVSAMLISLPLHAESKARASVTADDHEQMQQRWQSLPADKRERLMERYERFQKLSPEEQDAMKQRYEKWRELPENERRAMRDKWAGMSPDERRAARDRVHNHKKQKKQNKGSNNNRHDRDN